MKKKALPGIIVGNGDIAKALTPKEGFVFFAAGVSNSQEKRESEYGHEAGILLGQPKTHRLVYFSSLSVFYADGRYQKHKLQMEALIKKLFPKYCIVRLGNITWGDNPNTIINHLRNKIRKCEKLELKEVTRYLVSKWEFKHWMEQVPDWNCEFNITGEPLTPTEIVEKHLQNSGFYIRS